jgi:hypothetical protein
VQERGQQLGPRAAERVAERDGAAVDIDPGHVGVVFSGPGQHDGREGLVDLDDVDVIKA